MSEAWHSNASNNGRTEDSAGLLPAAWNNMPEKSKEFFHRRNITRRAEGRIILIDFIIIRTFRYFDSQH